MTSVTECRLRNNALSKLHHRKLQLENEILCRNLHKKKVTFAERVEKQAPEGTVTTIPQSTSSSSRSSSSISSSSSSENPTTHATSMQVDESDQNGSKRQKIAHGTDLELVGLVMEAEFDRLQRCSDRSFFLRQAKQDTDS